MNNAANTNSGETQAITIASGSKLVRITNVNDSFGNAQIGHGVTVLPGDSLVIWGVDHNRVGGPVAYDRSFAVGDVAEYDSYNLSYTGVIKSITAKTVTIVDGSLTRRLATGDFARRNRHFTIEASAKRNASWMD